MKANLQHIDEIRFFVIHLILINHWTYSLYLVEGGFDNTLVNFFFELTSPALSLISGYLFFYRTKDHFNFGKKLRSRFHSLVVPYLFWTCTFFVLYYVMKELYLHVFHVKYWFNPVQPINLKNLLASLADPPLVNFWYLQNLILIIPFNFLIYYLVRNPYIFFPVLVLIICIYAFNSFNLYFQPRFLPFYLLGSFFGYHEKHVPRIRLNYAYSIVLIPVLFFASSQTVFLRYCNVSIIIFKILIVFFFVFAVYNMFDSHQDSLLFRYLKKYKGYSFFLFAIHMFMFTLVQRALLKVGVETYLQNKYFALLFQVVSLAGVLFLTFSLAALIKSRLPKFYLLITGR
ncbi:MAG TPA: acyltransferase family protein [Puia sp.]|nr:acyltransferase family protein [Puia sp.]